MLIQFNFSNFKSFKDENSLDMTATSIKEHPYNLIDIDTNKKYLKVASIYGANASGKSNVIKAFEFMRLFVITSLRPEGTKNVGEETIPVKNYYFEQDSKNSPSLFEVFFVQDGVEYQYGFVLDQNKIHEEWLYHKKIKAKKINLLF